MRYAVVPSRGCYGSGSVVRPLTVLDIVEDYDADSEEGPHALMAYVCVRVRIGSKTVRVATMVGVPESDHGTVSAAGAGVRPFLRAWYADGTDHQDVPHEAKGDVQAALLNAAPRLWRDIQAMRDSPEA